MIDRKSRRVVIINNIQSDSIDQAIFILKDVKKHTKRKFNEDAVAEEAQKIINDYIRQVNRLKDSQKLMHKKRNEGKLLPFLITVGITAAFMCAVFFTVVYNF
ncbi:MAG: hypothetical protein IJ285_01585 [Clostridia bacterium]|nr:hypothetical protein [Oscillospiraceae bacterium]MBQ7959889.1 hypothetical protein [Clostridia bacterium]